jgi:hypothetical protein
MTFINLKAFNMKKSIFLSSIFLFCFLIYSFLIPQNPSPTAINNFVVQFVTTNQYGNNLFIDNLSIGDRYQNDIAVGFINNVNRDTSYSSFGSSTFKIAPQVSFLNVGKLNTTSAFNVTIQMNPGGYTSTKQVTSLNSGQSTIVTFDSATFTPNTGYSLKVWSSYSTDENKTNDTLYMNTYYKPGGKKNVLFQCYTSSTCSWCAVFNPSMDAFITQRFDTLVAIKYHMNFPSAGDPMYTANPTQNSEKQSYYSVSGIPVARADGVIEFGGYNTSNLKLPFYARLSKGSPISLTVVDTRIAGDSNKANVTLNIYTPLPTGNYKLQVEAIERKIHYATPPGSNGEMDFYDVFRRAYPTTTGTVLPSTAVGTYNFEFRYKRESAWVDSMYYTEVYVQNDVNKEVLNSAKARHYALDNIALKNINTIGKPPVAIRNSYSKYITGNTTDEVLSGYNFETFEATFPPSGWTITNPDNGFTFEQVNVCNGPLIPGNKCVRMNFYDYATTGQMDYLTTKIYNNVDLTDTISFNWAYSFISGYNDRLQVKVSTNGGSTYPYTIFDKTGSVLATAPSTNSGFVPASASEWGTFKVRVGSFITAIQPVSNEIPNEYSLSQNYPNPFNPTTNIKFALPKNGNVSIKVYDILGNLIFTIYDGYKLAGVYNASFDGSGLSSGIYFYKISSDNFTDTKKMILTK